MHTLMSVFGGESFSNWEFIGRKTQAEKIRHTVEFEDRVPGGEQIEGATWKCEPEDLSVDDVVIDRAQTDALLGAGRDGRFYLIRVQAEISNGEVYEQNNVLPVGNIYRESDKLNERRAIFMVRQFLRDRPDDNELNFGELQSSFDDMRRAVRSALSDWNSTQPHTDHDLDQFPVDARRLLYQKTAVEVLRSAAQSEGRNQYSYSDQGFSAEENSHAPMFMQFAQQLNAEYEKKKQKYKTAANAQSYWGGTSIDERYGNGSFGDHLH